MRGLWKNGRILVLLALFLLSIFGQVATAAPQTMPPDPPDRWTPPLVKVTTQEALAQAREARRALERVRFDATIAKSDVQMALMVLEMRTPWFIRACERVIANPSETNIGALKRELEQLNNAIAKFIGTLRQATATLLQAEQAQTKAQAALAVLKQAQAQEQNPVLKWELAFVEQELTRAQAQLTQAQTALAQTKAQAKAQAEADLRPARKALEQVLKVLEQVGTKGNEGRGPGMYILACC